MKLQIQFSVVILMLLSKISVAQLQDVQFDYQYDIHVETTDQPNTDLSFSIR